MTQITEPHYQPLSIRQTAKLLLPAIYQNARVICAQRLRRSNRLRRDQDCVQREYHQGRWKRVLKDKAWLKCTDVSEFVVIGDEETRVAKIDNKLVNMRIRDYYIYRLGRLQDLMIEYAGQESELIELGCGWGLNLFSLHMLNHWDRLTGFDISEYAIKAALEASEHFGLKNLFFGTLNLIQRDDPNWQGLHGKTVFTHHVLEQLKYSTSDVIENLLSSGVSRVIHMEPTTEMLRIWSLKDLLNFLYITRQDYQNNLLKTLRIYEAKGSLKIVAVKRLYFAPQIRHDGSLIVWDRMD